MRQASAAILGAYLCVVGAVVHRHTAYAGGIDWPWGLVLAVGTTYAVALAANRVLRVGGAWLALGWSLALLAQQFSPGGSYLVVSDWLGWSFTVGSLGAIVAGVVWPPRLSP